MDRKKQIKQLEDEWKNNPRWKNVKRGYTAEDVVRLRGSFVPECSLARKGADKFRQKNQRFSLSSVMRLLPKEFRSDTDYAPGKTTKRINSFIAFIFFEFC